MSISFSSYNPATGAKVWTGISPTPEEVNASIESSQKALPSWANLSINERAQYLLRYAEVLKEKQMTLATLISQETGKPLWDAHLEVQAAINKIPISLEAYAERCPEKIKSLATGSLITRHRPHGVVAVLGPFNFPAHLPNGHITPALLAGNTVLFKPSEFTPGVGEFLVQCWKTAGLPENVLQLIQGGSSVGQHLAMHPDINALFFTGSYPTGKILSEKFGSHPEKLLALELGGNNPLVITQNTDLRAAAYITLQSAFLSSGQRCTCARRLIITQEVAKAGFIELLTTLINNLKIGPYTENPEPFMGPVIHEKQVLHLLNVQKILIEQGALPIVKMKHLKQGTGFINPGLIDVTPLSNRPDEEYFGPFLQLIRVNNLNEAIHEANNTRFGLTAGLISNDPEEYQLFLHSVKAGIINWNTSLTGASSAAPFGGIGCSGNHRPSAYYAADYCAYPVASLESKELKLPTILLPGISL